jgi:TonB-linked SusC/RagA family outer membrane protein
MDNSVYNTINAYSSYNYTLNKNHNFTVLLGYQQDQFRYQNLQTLSKDLISFDQPGINLATGDKVPTESRYHWATQGFFGRFNYDYMGKYLFEFNGRIDGSSRFASNNRWGTFPSISVGYNIAREDFMSNLSKEINTLKLRGSYGFLGNQSGAAYYTYAQTMTTTAQGSWYFQNGRDMVINAPASFNPNTTWEKIENLDLGLDFVLLNNKLSGTFEVYERTTRDMLGPTADYADMYGATAPNTNNANLQNKGWELSLNWKGKIGKDIQYSVGGFISDYITTVLAYENQTKTGPDTNWYPGKRVGEIWGYRASGLIQTQAEADAYNTTYDLSYLTGQKWKPGDVKFIDINGDKKINKGTNVLGNMGDMEIIGNNAPRYIYTLNGMIKYKDVTLSMMWQGVGHRDWAPSGAYFWGSGAYAQVTVFKQHLDYWRGADDPDPNPNAYYPNPYTAPSGANASFQAKTQTISDRYLQNAAYIRLKNLTVSYDIPVRLISKCKLSKVSLFFSGENLLTYTKLAKMLDPEQVFAFQEGSKNYPLSTVYSFGLNVKF